MKRKYAEQLSLFGYIARLLVAALPHTLSCMETATKRPYPNNLKRYRRHFGYDRETVARLIGLKKSKHLTEWERGASLPDLINVLRLCYLYKVCPLGLFSDLFQATASALQEQKESQLPTIQL